MMFTMTSVTAEPNVAGKKYTFAQLWLFPLSLFPGAEISDPKSLFYPNFCTICIVS